MTSCFVNRPVCEFLERTRDHWRAFRVRQQALARPAFSAFSDVKNLIVQGQPVAAGYVWMTLLYAAIYSAAAIGAAIGIFSRREFK